MTTDLDRLIQQVPPGDPSLCEALMLGFYSYIYRLALSILNDPDEADDAAQETFIRATVYLERYQAETHLKSWLSAIAVNICRGLLRRRRARRNLQAVLRVIGEISIREAAPEEMAAQNEERDMLCDAVQSLGEMHRIPVLLRYVHGLSVPEIARIMDLSEGTVHSRLHYAHKKLRAGLGNRLRLKSQVKENR